MAEKKGVNEHWSVYRNQHSHPRNTRTGKKGMKRTGQRRRKNKSRSFENELEFGKHKQKFQRKKLLDQEKEIEEQWKQIQELQLLDTDS